MTQIAVTIAGSDSGGGAGIQADLKTFSALGVYGASVLTALTAQNTQGVQAVFDVPPEFVTRQMDSVFSDMTVAAVKIGMMSRTAVVEAVAAGLDRWRTPNVVLDPVMIAASGDRLISADAVEALKSVLIPRALLVTPNLQEAAAILETEPAKDEAAMRMQAQALLSFGPRAVLIKGGHSEGPEAVDILVREGRIDRLSAPRIATANTHGTGCTLSSAIAAELAKGRDLLAAVNAGKDYVSKAIAAAGRLSIGHGRGPTHHFHVWW